MMESTTLWLGAYLRKNGRENDYSSEPTAPPFLEDTGTSPVARLLGRWRRKQKRIFQQVSGWPVLPQKPFDVRAVRPEVVLEPLD